jgi:hypothetical protein
MDAAAISLLFSRWPPCVLLLLLAVTMSHNEFLFSRSSSFVLLFSFSFFHVLRRFINLY